MGNFFATLNADVQEAVVEIRLTANNNPEALVRNLIIDRPRLDGFKWKVWWVAASGFFTASFAIFSSNVVSPALSFVYPSGGGPNLALVMNIATLVGTLVGQVVFGYLADRYGRKSIYGLELCIVIVATIGTTTSASGIDAVSQGVSYNSLSMYGLIAFWRVLLGLGIGAEYPLSAVIAAEWSSTRSRGQMMAAVFLMQSFGQLAAYGFGLAILVGVTQRWGLLVDADPSDDRYIQYTKLVVDVVWRLTIGVGSILAVISLFLRRIIPETPLYLASRGNSEGAVEKAVEIYPISAQIRRDSQRIPGQDNHADGVSHVAGNAGAAQTNGDTTRRLVKKKRKKHWWTATLTFFGEAKEYLGQKGRGQALAAVCVTWFLLDLAYYGLGLDNPKIVNAIWFDTPPANASCSATWLLDPSLTNKTIYETLYEDAVHSLAIVTSGTVLGSIIFLCAVNYIPRVTWMAWMFVALSALFAIMGASFFRVYETSAHALTMVLYALAQLFFNLGPNTITFMLPAELFGTKFRGTFYGMAAASGKLGAITIQLINNYVITGGTPGKCTPDRNMFAGMLLILAFLMIIGAFVTWIWIPEVQFPRGAQPVLDDDASDTGNSRSYSQQLVLPNRPLEQISQDPASLEPANQNPEGTYQTLGFMPNMRKLFGIEKKNVSIEAQAEPQPLMGHMHEGNGGSYPDDGDFPRPDQDFDDADLGNPHRIERAMQDSEVGDTLEMRPVPQGHSTTLQTDYVDTQEKLSQYTFNNAAATSSEYEHASNTFPLAVGSTGGEGFSHFHKAGENHDPAAGFQTSPVGALQYGGVHDAYGTTMHSQVASGSQVYGGSQYDHRWATPSPGSHGGPHHDERGADDEYHSVARSPGGETLPPAK